MATATSGAAEPVWEPVYFFAADKKPGDMLGDGKNKVWHIIAE